MKPFLSKAVFVCIAIWLLMPQLAAENQSQCDSLKRITEKVNQMIDNNRQTALDLAIGVSDAARRLKCPEPLSDALTAIGYIRYYAGESEAARKVLQESIAVAVKARYYQGEIHARNRLSRVLTSEGNLEEAENMLINTLASSVKYNDTACIAHTCYAYGNFFMMQGLEKKAMEYYQRAHNLAEKAGLHQVLTDSKISMAVVHKHALDFELSKNLFAEAYDIAEKRNDMYSKAFIYNNLAEIEYFNDNYEGAIDYSYKAIDVFEVLNDRLGTAKALSVIGNILVEMSRYDQSVEFYYQSLKIYQETDNPYGIAESLFLIGHSLHAQNQLEKAREYYLQSLGISKKFQEYKLMRDIYKALVSLSFSLQEYDKAYKYLQLFSRLSDSTAYGQSGDATEVSFSNAAFTESGSRWRENWLYVLLLTVSLCVNAAFAAWILLNRSRKRRMDSQQAQTVV